MANTGSQALQIGDLLVQRLQLFDPSLDVSENSPLYQQVVQPVITALGTDVFDTDVDTFLKDRLRQEYPNLSVAEGEAIVDLLVKPVRVLLESMKRETQIVRRGQSVRNASTMRLEDAEAFAANFFVNRRVGNRANGVVRILFSQPTFVAILSTISFSTPSGLRFFPTRPQVFTPDILLLQRSGTFYYVDVPIVAEEAGTEYNVTAGTITQVTGLSGVARVTNLNTFTGGTEEETTQQLIDRTSQSLSERSLNTKRGIGARLLQDFPDIRNLEVVGFGDPEMQRDILTGGGQGRIVASGTCFIVGQFCLMFSQYEDRGPRGDVRIEEGDEIEFNYWKFLYNTDPEDAHEVFTIENIVFDTRETFTEDLPSVVLFQLSGTPSVAPPVAATLPGVFPGVFCVVRKHGILQISNIPGGITNPDGPRGTIVINDNEVHIGGHYDVWVRPSVDVETTVDQGVNKTESAYFEETDLYVCGESPRFKNQVHREFKISYSVLFGAVQLAEIVESASGAVAKIIKKTADFIWLSEFGETAFSAGDILTGRTSLARISVTEVFSWDLEQDGYRPGMLLSIVSGADLGVYKIVKVSGPFAYVDTDLSSSVGDLAFRVVDEVISSVFTPKNPLMPFGDVPANDLRTVIGSATVRTDIDLLKYGVRVGDTLEITSGLDLGIYTISSFDSVFGGTGPVLSRTMTSTSSDLNFKVYRAGNPMQAPLVRILPGGISVLDPNGQDSGTKVPYALPVEGRALEAFSGAFPVSQGKNGFVLSDPGKNWEPTGDLFADTSLFAEAKTCFADDCVPCDGYVAVVSLTDDGKFYLDSMLPAAAKQFLSDLYDWLKSVIDTFGLGADADAFVDGFHPIILGPPDTSVSSILYQAEVCIPAEIFDGCNNVFVAIPEFDWKSEFGQMGDPASTGTITFSEVLDKWNTGELLGGNIKPALMQAKPGSSLKVLNGPNSGSYLVDKVYSYKLCHGGAIVSGNVDLNKCYDVAIVAIKGSFPVNPLSGIAEFFAEGVPALTVPLPPNLNVESTDTITGLSLSPWEVFESVLTWLFQWLDSMGFDLPDGVDLDPAETLTAIWQLLFSEYEVGQPTGRQNVRMTFIEPTSVTCYNVQPCIGYAYNPPNYLPISISNDSAVAFPIAALTGQTVTIVYTDVNGPITFTTVLGPSAGAAVNLSALATILKNALDPFESFIKFVVEGDWFTERLLIQTVKGSEGLVLELDAIPSQLDFSTTTGTSQLAPGEQIEEVYDPKSPTLFSAAAGATELLFTANSDDYLQVIPGEVVTGKTAKTSLPRDVVVAEDYAGATSNVLTFTDGSSPSAVIAGVAEQSDVLKLYEHRQFLEFTIASTEDDIASDRVIAVTTTFGSNVIRLPQMAVPDFNFLSATTGDEFDEVQVGDIVMIEEGDDLGGYIVVRRSEFELEISAPMTAATLPILASGNDGVIAAGTAYLDSATATFTTDHVGRYLTIWAVNRDGYAGSYEITAVTNLGSSVRFTLSTSVFDNIEQEIHWAITRAPADTPGSSAISGRSELVAVKPIRIYNGTASEFRVVGVSPHLDRSECKVTVAHDSGLPPREGVKQPFEIVRTGVQHLSSTAMKAQGRELGLYYFDVLSTSLSADLAANVPEGTRLEPVFGSYDSDGYRLEVGNNTLSYSPEEDCRLVISPTVLPTGFEDTLPNRVAIEGRNLRIRYDYAPLVSQVQRLLVSEADRILCANPLARHFLPSYVYLDVNVVGGNTVQTIASQIIDEIDSLQPTDDLDVSRLEKVLHNNSVVRYDHPVTAIIVTHDLDRRVVAFRSVNKIGEDEIVFNGSNRTTFFIPGEDRSGLSSEQIPDGERIYIYRGTPTSTLR